MYDTKFLRIVIICFALVAVLVSAFPEDMDVSLVPAAPKSPPPALVATPPLVAAEPPATLAAATSANNDGDRSGKTVLTWRIQLGSFSAEKNAYQLVKKLRAAGFSPKYEKVGGSIRVVLAGVKESDRESTETRLTQNGFSGYLLREETTK